MVRYTRRFQRSRSDTRKASDSAGSDDGSFDKKRHPDPRKGLPLVQSGLVPAASTLILRGGLSWVAWTQIIPAVLAWLFAIMMLTALLLIGMDSRGENPATVMAAFAERFPAISESVGAWFEARVAPSIEAATDPETGAVHFDRIDFWAAASYIWFWLALIGTILGFIWRMIVGPRPTRSLGQKLVVALGACGVFSLVLLLCLITLPDNFEGSTPEWIILAISGGLTVFVFTAWAVVCSHGIGKLADMVAPVDDARGRDQGV